MTTANFDGVELAAAVPDAIVVEVTRQIVGERRHTSVEIAGRAGSWKFPEEPGDLEIVLRVHVGSDSFADRRAAFRALAAWASTSEAAALIVDDEPDRYYLALLDNEPSPGEWLVDGEAELKFTADPYARSTTESEEIILATGPPDSGTFEISDLVAVDPEITITPTNGNLTSFALVLNGAQVQWQLATQSPRTILVNTDIVVSSISDTVTIGASVDMELTGMFDPDDVDMATVSIPNNFPELVPGSNSWSLNWTGTATAVTVTIAWRERII
jgi:predicted phage tail component-like protein